MYEPNHERNKTFLHFEKLDLYDNMPLPQLTKETLNDS
jgi:hypothetical protein